LCCIGRHDEHVPILRILIPRGSREMAASHGAPVDQSSQAAKFSGAARIKIQVA